MFAFKFSSSGAVRWAKAFAGKRGCESSSDLYRYFKIKVSLVTVVFLSQEDLKLAPWCFIR